MDIKQIFFSFLFFTILLFSCKNNSSVENNQPKENNVTPLSFETKSFHRKAGECKEDYVKCIQVKLKYPEANQGIEKTRDTINKYINSMLLEAIVPDPDKKVKNIDDAAALLIQYYEDQITEFPDYEMAWEVDVDGTAQIIQDYAVITLPVYSNMGGAHPNHFTAIANFNLETGKELKLRDIVEDNKAFKTLAEKKFIEARLTDYDLGEVNIDDFFFGEGFQLPENFGITKEGIYFYYNPYEAAPYALGSTEFTISFKELEGIVQL